jgi:hypothetical protein
MGGEVVVVSFTGMCTSAGTSGNGSTTASAGRAATCREEEGKEGAEGSSDLLAAVGEDAGGRRSSWRRGSSALDAMVAGQLLLRSLIVRT